MTLSDIDLTDLPPEVTIFAKRPWNAQSEAILVSEEVETIEPREGCDYFLEAEVIAQFASEMVASGFSKAEMLAIVIHYAEHDAFPDWARAKAANPSNPRGS